MYSSKRPSNFFDVARQDEAAGEATRQADLISSSTTPFACAPHIRYTCSMLRVALFALPGPGHAILKRIRPILLVRGAASDFAETDLPAVAATAPDFPDRLKDARPDVMLVAGWEHKIPAAWYQHLPHGGWNIHPSLLPKYRGHNPYFHVLANGEAETGVTVHRLTDRIDEGEILLQKKIAITPDETLGSLWVRLAELGTEAAAEALRMIDAPSFDPAALPSQPGGSHPEARRVAAADRMLSSSMTVEQARHLIRACNPFYGALAEIDGVLLKVYEAAAQENNSAAGPAIRFRDGALVLTVVDVEGIGIISGKDLLRRWKEAR